MTTATIDRLLLRRVIDAQGKAGPGSTAARRRSRSCAGRRAPRRHPRPARLAGLTRAAARCARCSTATAASPPRRSRRPGRAGGAMPRRWTTRTRQTELERERERLAWQLGEVDRLAPGADEWDMLNAEHARLANAQALIDAAQSALGPGLRSRACRRRAGRSRRRRAGCGRHARPAARRDQRRAARRAGAAAGTRRTLGAYLHRTEPDPEQLARLDERLSASGRPGAALPACARRAAGAARAVAGRARRGRGGDGPGRARSRRCAGAVRLPRRGGEVTPARRRAAAELSQAVTQAMQQLGMAGGRFEVALTATDGPQSYGPGSCRVPRRRATPADAPTARQRSPPAASCRASHSRSR